MRAPADLARRPRAVSGACVGLRRRAARAPPRRAPLPRARASWPPPPATARRRPTSCAAAACGHMQVAEFPAEPELDEAYAEVDEAAYLDEEAGQRATARAGARRDRAPPAGRGAHRATSAAGSASCVSEAEARGWQARGVEPSRFAAEYARDALGLDVATGTLDRPTCPRRPSTRWSMGDVIEHLPDPGDGARPDPRGCCAPGGVLYLAAARRRAAGWRGVLGARWWSVLPTHVQYFTRASLARAAGPPRLRGRVDGTAPKAFTVRYYLERLEGYSPPRGSRRGGGGRGRWAWPTASCGPTSATGWRSWPAAGRVSRVAVIGAGVAGLAAGYELARRAGRSTSTSAGPGLGGQAATIDVGDGVLLERYYHHLFTSDRAHRRAVPTSSAWTIEWHPSSVGVLRRRRAATRSPRRSTCCASRRSRCRARLRMGLAVLLPPAPPHARSGRSRRRTARDWIVRDDGARRPGSGCGARCCAASSAIAPRTSRWRWLWSKLTAAPPDQGRGGRGARCSATPRGTFEPLLRRLREEIEAPRGRVLIDRPAAARVAQRTGRFAVTAGAPGLVSPRPRPRAIRAPPARRSYDAVLATVPNPIFEQLLDPGLALELAAATWSGCARSSTTPRCAWCSSSTARFSPVLLDQRGRPELPFVGLIEQTQPGRPPSTTADAGSSTWPTTCRADDPLLAPRRRRAAGRATSPACGGSTPTSTARGCGSAWLFREPDAQPIVTRGLPRADARRSRPACPG